MTSKSLGLFSHPPSMPRGSDPIIPRGSAFRICLWQIHGSRRRAGARVRGGFLGDCLGIFFERDDCKRRDVYFGK